MQERGLHYTLLFGRPDLNEYKREACTLPYQVADPDPGEHKREAWHRASWVPRTPGRSWTLWRCDACCGDRNRGRRTRRVRSLPPPRATGWRCRPRWWGSPPGRRGSPRTPWACERCWWPWPGRDTGRSPRTKRESGRRECGAASFWERRSSARAGNGKGCGRPAAGPGESDGSGARLQPAGKPDS